MSGLFRRPTVVALLLAALTALLIAESAVLATSYLRSGGPVKAVKVVTDDFDASTTSLDPVDVPNMAVTMSVPSGERALFLVTFSAEAKCTGGTDSFYPCVIRVLLDNAEMPPGPVGIDTNIGNGYELRSVQFLASPVSAGQHTVKVQFWRSAQDGSELFLRGRTLSVLRSKL